MLHRPAAFAILTLAGMPCFAQDTPPPLKDGQVVSADVFNEIIQRLDNVSTGFTISDDLVGTWRITAMSGRLSSSNTSYSNHPSGLFSVMNDTITFTKVNDVSYTYVTTSNRMNVASTLTGPENGVYFIAHNQLFLTMLNGDIPGATDRRTGAIQKLTKDKFVWQLYHFNDMVVIFERQDLPPNPPADLSASTSGLTVTMSWSAGSDASSFKILRKTTLDGEYIQIATTTAKSHTDTVPAAGDYWYRVVATNATGDSLGSNVAKVSVTQ